MSNVRSSASNTALPNEPNGHLARSDAEWNKILTPKEFAVLRKGATDPRHIGYDDHFVPGGVYVCAGCGSPLYESKHKWDCGCGWPGFWDCIPKAVMERPETDGSSRVEIVCRACLGHLGHVFRGEGFSNPPPNERHCVNSTSIKFHAKSLDEYGKANKAANAAGSDQFQ